MVVYNHLLRVTRVSQQRQERTSYMFSGGVCKGDNDLAVCVDLDDQKWEENFMENLVQEEIADTTEEVSDVDEEFDISLPSPKIKFIDQSSCLSSCIQFNTYYFRSVCVTMETLYSCF